MEIFFDLRDSSDVEKALSREWIDTDRLGNYSSSTILGLNTRKRHGLFVLRQKEPDQYLVLLSHLQEDYYDGENQLPIFSVEYEGQILLEGLRKQTGFRLDPFPTFIY